MRVTTPLSLLLAWCWLPVAGATGPARVPGAGAQDQSPAVRDARLQGYNAGYRDGREDARLHHGYDFRDRLPYRNAEGWSAATHMERSAWQLAYRSGYEAGYDDGFYGRPQDAWGQPERHYHPEFQGPPPPVAWQGTVAAGGILGTVLGAVAGGGKGAAIGAAAGAGVGLALAGHNGALVLAAGTPMTITLRRPLYVH